jgi:hypothetical protein
LTKTDLVELPGSGPGALDFAAQCWSDEINYDIVKKEQNKPLSMTRPSPEPELVL